MDFLFLSTPYAFDYSSFQKQESIANKSVFPLVENKRKISLNELSLRSCGLQSSDHFLILYIDEALKTTVNPTETFRKIYLLAEQKETLQQKAKQFH